MERVAERTYRIEPTLPGVGLVFSTYLINAGRGVLIEPGPTATIPAVREAMDKLGMTDLAYVIPTHLHMDHAGGIGSLAEIFPESKVILHPLAARHAEDPTRLIDSTRVTYGDSFESLYGSILPVPQSQILVLDNGDTFQAGEHRFRVLYAPGHAPHHIAIFDQTTRCLFCGEALGMPTDTPLPAAAYPSFNLDDCLSTMEKLQSLNPRILCYSHGGTASDPASRIPEVIRTTRTFGEMILKSLRNGDSTESIGRMIRQQGSAHFPPHWEEEMVRVWLAGMVNGYTLYFHNKGLV